MELTEAIISRRAIREYCDTPVEHARIEQLINSANLAPSAMNRQPWAFAVLTDPVRISDYGFRAKLWLLKNLAKKPADPSLKRLLEDPAYTLFHGAPALVLILATSAEQQAAEDCCLAAQNFMLAAREEGIGTCWIALARPWLNLPPIKSELGIPKKCTVVAPIVLGYPKAWPAGYERNPAEIHWLG